MGAPLRPKYERDCIMVGAAAAATPARRRCPTAAPPDPRRAALQTVTPIGATPCLAELTSRDHRRSGCIKQGGASSHAGILAVGAIRVLVTTKDGQELWLTLDWARRVTGKHRTTVRRWKETGRWPPEVLRLAGLEVHGRIGLIHRAWTGWMINPRTGELVTPDNWSVDAGAILTWRIVFERVRALEAELAKLRAAQPRGEPDWHLRARVIAPG